MRTYLSGDLSNANEFSWKRVSVRNKLERNSTKFLGEVSTTRRRKDDRSVCHYGPLWQKYTPLSETFFIYFGRLVGKTKEKILMHLIIGWICLIKPKRSFGSAFHRCAFERNITIAWHIEASISTSIYI